MGSTVFVTVLLDKEIDYLRYPRDEWFVNKTPFVVCKRPEAVVFIDCDGHHGVAHSVSDVAMT